MIWLISSKYSFPESWMNHVWRTNNTITCPSKSRTYNRECKEEVEKIVPSSSDGPSSFIRFIEEVKFDYVWRQTRWIDDPFPWQSSRFVSYRNCLSILNLIKNFIFIYWRKFSTCILGVLLILLMKNCIKLNIQLLNGSIRKFLWFNFSRFHGMEFSNFR